MNLSLKEKLHLRKLRDRADEFYELLNAQEVMTMRLSKMRMELFGQLGAFEKFWKPIREREAKGPAESSRRGSKP